MTWIPAKITGTFQAGVTATQENPISAQLIAGQPVRIAFGAESLAAEISFSDAQVDGVIQGLTPEQLQALYDDWRARHSEPVPEPEPHVCPPCPPEGFKLVPIDEPEPAPADPWEYDLTSFLAALPPGLGKLWNVECDASMVANLVKSQQAYHAAVVGPSASFEEGTDFTKFIPWQKSSIVGGTGRATKIKYKGEGAAIRSTSTEQTQSLLANMRIHGRSGGNIIQVNGLSNMSGLANVDLREGFDQILLLPGVDASTAFMGHLFNLFAFMAQGSVLHAKAGNGKARHLCRLTIVKADIGRCKGPVLLFEDCIDVDSQINVIGAQFDLSQSGFSAPHAICFNRSGRTPLYVRGGNVRGGAGKAVFYSDAPNAEDAWSIESVQLVINPKLAVPNYPEFQIWTPTLQIPGDANGGIVNWRGKSAPARAA